MSCTLNSRSSLCMANCKIRRHFLWGIAILLGLPVRDLAVLFMHLLVTVARLAEPGGARAVVAESVLVKHQLLILIGRANGRPISVPPIAWSPVCVRSSNAVQERSFGSQRQPTLQ